MVDDQRDLMMMMGFTSRFLKFILLSSEGGLSRSAESESGNDMLSVDQNLDVFQGQDLI